MSEYEKEKPNSNNRNSNPERKGLKIVDPFKFGRAILLTFTLAASIGAGANHLTEKVTGSDIPELLDNAKKTAIEFIDDRPNYTEEMQSVLAEKGDTLWDMVQDNIENSNEADIRRLVYDVKNLEQNKETFEDGALQAGEFVKMPAGISIKKP